MATFSGAIENGQIIFKTWLSLPGRAVDLSSPNSFSALLDTGAQLTSISANVATRLGLVSTGAVTITPVTGQPIALPKYRVRIDIPIGGTVALPGGGTASQPVLSGKEIDVAELPYQPNNYDVLLGMDFLFGYHLTVFGGQFILSN